MRMCAIQNCPSNSHELNKWMEETCSIHNCKHLTGTCICAPPFSLIPFPTERRDNEGRTRWTEIVCKNHICGKEWQPKSRTNSRICSKHFVDGEPSLLHPDPTLLLSLPPVKRKRPLIPLPRIPLPKIPPKEGNSSVAATKNKVLQAFAAHQAPISNCSGRKDCLCMGCIWKRTSKRTRADKVGILNLGGHQILQSKPKDNRCETKYVKVEGEEDCFEIEGSLSPHQDESEENSSSWEEQQLDKDGEDEPLSIKVAGDEGCYIIGLETLCHDGPDEDEDYKEEGQLPLDSAEEEVATGRRNDEDNDNDANCGSNTYKNLMSKLQASESKSSDKKELISENTIHNSVRRGKDSRNERHSLSRERIEGGSRSAIEGRCDVAIDLGFKTQGSEPLDKIEASHIDVMQDLEGIGEQRNGEHLELGSHTENLCDASQGFGPSDCNGTDGILSNGAAFIYEPDNKSVVREEDNVSSSDESCSSNNTEPYPLSDCEEELLQDYCLTPDMPTDILPGDNLHYCQDSQVDFALEDDLTAHMETHNKAKPYHCGLCNIWFSNVAELTSHMHIHNLEMPYQCGVCNEEFGDKDELTRHKRIHKRTNVRKKHYQCSRCNKGFGRKDNLTRHMKTHIGEKTFECPQIGDKDELTRHKRIHQRTNVRKKRYQCSRCNKGFATKGNLTRHMKTHIGEKTFECPQCGKRFQRRSNFSVHIRQHREKPYRCSKCKKGFASELDFTGHMKAHAGEKNFGCPQCGKRFQFSSYLSTHMKRHDKNPHHCPKCEMRFAESDELTQHMMTGHAREKPFQCSECYKEFSVEDLLTAHMRTHTGETPYLCSECNKWFTQENYFIEHMRTHTGERPYQCSVCNKAFVRKSHLNRHMGIHTGRKPHRCPECNRDFLQRSHLIDHMRRHIGEKPFQCSECDLAFIHRSQLRRHVRVHTGEKPYVCSECSDRFTHRGVYLNHLKTHGKAKYQCSQCDKGFAMKSQLTKHMSTHSIKEEPYECLECHIRFAHKKTFMHHKYCHTRVKPHKLPQSQLNNHIKTHTGENIDSDLEFDEESTEGLKLNNLMKTNQPNNDPDFDKI